MSGFVPHRRRAARDVSPMRHPPTDAVYDRRMDEIASPDPRVEIERLEDQIEKLSAKLENCRKFVLASRVAMALGGALLLALVLGLIPFDLTSLTAAFAALLGGIVVGGSNGSTAREAGAELAAAERDRAAMIGLIELRTVGERATLH